MKIEMTPEQRRDLESYFRNPERMRQQYREAWGNGAFVWKLLVGAEAEIASLRKELDDLREKYSDYHEVSRANGELAKELAQVKASVHECCGKASGCATAKANEIFRRERDAALSEVAALKESKRTIWAKEQQKADALIIKALEDRAEAAESELSALREKAEKGEARVEKIKALTKAWIQEVFPTDQASMLKRFADRIESAALSTTEPK